MTKDLTPDKKEAPVPLKLNFYTIFRALSELFPDNAFLIFNAIKNIVLIKDEIPGFSTMGIDRKGNLYVHIDFWNTWMTNISALKTVLMHELLHYVSGDIYTLKTEEDSKDYKLENLADMIAMDSRINAFINTTVYHSRQEDARKVVPTYQDNNLFTPYTFFHAFYNESVIESDFLNKLLVPGSVFRKNVIDEINLSKYYGLFYSNNEFGCHKALSRVILDILKKRNKEQQNKTNIILIGSHGEDGEEIDLESLDPNTTIIINKDSDLDDKEKNQIKQHRSYSEEDKEEDFSIKQSAREALKGLAKAFGSNSKAKNLVSKYIADSLNVTEKFDIERFKKFAFDSIFSNVRNQAKRCIGTWKTSPVMPNILSVSDTIKEAFDYPTMFFKRKKNIYTMDKNLLPIYLDVSGSTYSYLPEIITLISNVSDKLDYIWGFSTQVVKHTMEDLVNRNIKSTGGTCFKCVIQHAIENEFKHIVVITDGDASNPFTGKISDIESVVTILFGYANKQNYFSKHYENTHSIEEVKI
jgi:hypothetical protein